MDYEALSVSAEAAINKLEKYTNKVGSTGVLESITKQLIFIRDKAVEGKNPLFELEEKKYFTYRILASKEFASPEELEIKKSIDYVSRILDPD